MRQHYRNPERASDPHALPNVEVFWVGDGFPVGDTIDDGSGSGWYYWPCFPGCLPDGEATGPFATEADALADAREGNAS